MELRRSVARVVLALVVGCSEAAAEPDAGGMREDGGAQPDAGSATDSGVEPDARTDGGVTPADGGPQDGGADPCDTPTGGSLASALALAVLGRVFDVDAEDGAMTIVGTYSTDVFGTPGDDPVLGFGTLAAPPATVFDGFVYRQHDDGTDAWVTRLGGDGNNEVHGVATDGAGAIYVTGRSHSSVLDAAGLPVNGVSDRQYVTFIAKLRSSDGRAEWVQRVVGPAPGPGMVSSLSSCRDVAVSGAHVVVSCNFQGGQLTFTGTGGIEYSEAPAGRSSEVTLGIDAATGEAVWSTTIGNLTSDAITGAALSPAPGGNFYAIGASTSGTLRVRGGDAELSSSNTTTGRRGFLAEIDGATGAPQWIRAIDDTGDASSDGVRQLTALARGDALFIAGDTASGIRVGTESADGDAIFVLALPLDSASTASPRWLVSIPNGIPIVRYTGLAVDRCGRPSIGVESSGAFGDPSGGVSVGAVTITRGVGVLRFDTDGTPLWYAGFDIELGAAPYTTAVIGLVDGTTTLGGRFPGRADLGAGEVGFDQGDQPFVVSYGP